MQNLFRTSILAGAMLALATGPALASAQDDDKPAVEPTKGEKELAKLLEGRVAGEPRSCIFTPRVDNLRIIDKTALVYGRGKTIYVNRTKHPEDIDEDDILVINRYSGSQLCRVENVITIDRYSQFLTGVIFLDDFIPYTRVKDGGAGDDGGEGAAAGSAD